MSTHRTGGESRETGRWISPGSGSSYAQAIQAVELPPTVSEYADAYDRVVGERDRFLWKWIHNLFDEFTLSCVADGHRDAVKRQKTLLTMFVTTLDDLAERGETGSTFERARDIPFFDPPVAETTLDGEPALDGADSDDSPGDAEVVAFLADVWEAVEGELESAPRRDEFAAIFEFDMRQSINSMDYSRILNDHRSMANLTETERYDAHNMAMFPYACIDLMHAPEFDRAELGSLRSLLAELQRMARIGNWLTTWERELAEGDCSSGVLVKALQRGVLDPEEVAEADRGSVAELVDRVRSYGIESEFIREWERRNRAVRKRTGELDSVDGAAIVDGLESVMNHHLASDGYK